MSQNAQSLTPTRRWILLALAIAGCGDVMVERDGGSPSDAATELDAASELDAATRSTCDGLPSGEEAERASAEATAAALEAEGFSALGAGARQDVFVYNVDREGLVDGDPAPLYVTSEAELLTRPDDDGARIWYERTPPTIDWSTQALLFYFYEEPFTDVALYARPGELLLMSTHFAGCVPPEDPPYPPRERLRRAAVVVPREDTLTVRTREVSYALRHFDLEPGFERTPDGPLLSRNAGRSTVALVGDTWHLWAEGYSGATGFIFHGTSRDGVAWDFRWDAEHTTTFEGLGTFDHKLSPSVIVDGAELHLFFLLPDADPRTDDLHRATSTDGIAWSDVRRVSMPCDVRHPYVQREGDVLHAWGHAGRTARLSHATSTDGGSTWSCAPAPMLERGGSDDMDGRGIYHPAVVRYGERWVMFYAAAYGFREPYRVYLAYAVSEDGVTFERGAPLLAQTLEPGHWESGLGNLGRPVPIVRGADTWLYYSAAEGGEPSIGLTIGEGWSPP